MLARISTGGGGIVEYLETGRKQGREFHRDLIDTRLHLEGDIDVLDSLIGSIETQRPGDAKYLHITLGFAEKFTTAESCGQGEVNRAKMEEVACAYKELVMAAFLPSEYHWYAEIHTPKVTHEVHQTSGESIERLPHVHIVLPFRNLVDGSYLHPYGFGKIDFQQGMQETINARFGLKSPLDAPRVLSEQPLLRHTAELATAKTVGNLRADIAKRLSVGDITSFEAFAKAMTFYGEVKVRNGKDGDYLNVKPAWADRGINLKEFTPALFAEGGTGVVKLAVAPKTSAGASSYGKGAGVAGTPSKQQLDALTTQWIERVSHETRYLNGANKTHYAGLTFGERAEWLAGRIEKSRALCKEAEGQTQQITFKESYEHPKRSSAETQYLAGLHKPNFRSADRRESPGRLDSMQLLSGIPLVCVPRDGELLLPYDAQNLLGQENGNNPALRRSRAGPRAKGRSAQQKGLNNPEGYVDQASYLQTTQIKSIRKAVSGRSNDGITADQLKNDTNPRFVLDAAAKKYMLDTSRYDIGIGRDGASRITHEGNKYNLGDFFTKHLQVSWAEAQTVLNPCYAKTLADAIPEPNKQLWSGFIEFQRNSRLATSVAIEQSRVRTAKNVTEARNSYKAAKVQAREMPVPKRAPFLSKARAEQVVVVMANQAAHAVLKKEKIQPRNAAYRQYLGELANASNTQALDELRRMAPTENNDTNTISGGRSQAVFAHPQFRVGTDGAVTYFQIAHGDALAADKSTALVKDSRKGVSVVDASSQGYALALKVAVARYGTTLTLSGDKVFMAGMVTAARSSGLNLQLHDASRPQATPQIIKKSNDLER